MSNIKWQASADENSNENVKEAHEFLKKTGDDEKLEEQIIEDAFRSLKHVKTDSPYVPPTAQDAVTIEKETKTEANDFVKTALEFNKVDRAATRQKKKIITRAC